MLNTKNNFVSNKTKPNLGEGMEECTVCHKKHPKAFMAKHMKNRHSEKPGRFHCEMCDKTCTTEEGLNLHKTIHSGLSHIKYLSY